MYYLITIRAKQSEINQCDFNYDVVVVAKSMEDAKSDFESNHEDYEELIDIREISVEERIEREQKEILEWIKRECMRDFAKNMTLREFPTKQDELLNNKELEYLLLQAYKKKLRIKRVVGRQEGIDNLTIKEYDEIVCKIVDAQTEEEINEILKKINTAKQTAR